MNINDEKFMKRAIEVSQKAIEHIQWRNEIVEDIKFAALYVE